MSKIITGKVPREYTVVEEVPFGERADLATIRAIIERQKAIPTEASFRTMADPEWGQTELRWTWYEVEL